MNEVIFGCGEDSLNLNWRRNGAEFAVPRQPETGKRSCNESGSEPQAREQGALPPPRHKLATVNEASLQLADPGQWRKHASSLLLALGALSATPH